MSTFGIVTGREQLDDCGDCSRDALGELDELGFGMPSKILGGIAVAAIAWGLYAYWRRRKIEAAERVEEGDKT